MSKQCVICKTPLAPSRQDDNICHRAGCKGAYSDWAVANFDKLDPNSKWRKHYEEKFWEVTPEQKKHFARFFELMRPPRRAKPKRCLKCRGPVEKGSAYNDHHICGQCHRSNNHYSEVRA